jgi:hypothetical protein
MWNQQLNACSIRQNNKVISPWLSFDAMAVQTQTGVGIGQFCRITEKNGAGNRKCLIHRD